MYTKRISKPRAWCVAALVLMLGTFAGSALADPPDRVARVGYLRGNVSFQPAGGDQWTQVSLNRPLGTGDKVYADRDSRVEFQIGSADIRLDQNSTFNLLNLDDNTAQLQLTEGVLNLHVRRVGRGQNYEVDTPTLAFVVNQPGDYRVDIDPRGNSTMVTVFQGGGEVYGENNASYSVRSGNSYRFNDSALRDYEVLDVPRPDDFDQWCRSRDTRYERSVSRRYVSEDVIGYSDLDDYGSWNSVPSYGNVWYPTTVEAGWAPYRSGYWSWVDPWGWTWIDNASWGFAPFHYGRWAYIGNRWGWCPGPRNYGAVYAPALVAFVGGGGWGTSVSIGIGGGPVGWFPLGPRDVYVPWYSASRDYFTNVNVRNTTVINNTNITNIYNNYSAGRPITNVNYAYQRDVAAVTAVSRDAFIGAQPVANSRVSIDAGNLRTAQVVSRVGIAPTQASFVAANAERTRVAPPAAALDRNVIARTAPPPMPAPIATRLQAIERNGAQPLATNQLREIAARPATGVQAGNAAPSRVQVVGQNAPRPQPLPMRGNAATERPGASNERMNPAVVARPTPANPATPVGGRSSVTAPGNEGRGQSGAPTREALPSSRFAPHADAPAAARTLPESRGNPTAQPQGRGPANAETRAPAATQAPSRAVPSERFAPHANPAPAAEPRVMERQQPAQPPRSSQNVERQTLSAPPREIRQAPPVREVPRETAQPQYQPAPRVEQRVEPRSAPQPQYQPQPRSAPQPQYEPRSAPQPQEYQQPRNVPQPQYQQPRSMPQPQAQPQQYQQPRDMPQQQQPQRQERQPVQRQDEKKDKDNGNR
ncbi:DUF6600 domain-containing protein [Dokdonella soli]|uniref:FecR protein domain-containing protein n=1 Tax=Dokdonella soli TaxID=529810 RepID=A0ABP3TW09_9GAMM